VFDLLAQDQREQLVKRPGKDVKVELEVDEAH
jgi:hypothetical protein